MTDTKMIEEMAITIAKARDYPCCGSCSTCDARGVFCLAYDIAVALVNEGYKKQSEGVWFFTEYEYFTCSVCLKSHFNFCDSSAEARRKLTDGEYYPYCPECGAKMKGGAE